MSAADRLVPGDLQGLKRPVSTETFLVRELVLENLPPEHPIRQEHASLVARLALAEGRIATTLEYLEREARQVPYRRSTAGHVIESVGCRLTGQQGAWWPRT